ncbi:MAG: S-methyl-5'-thioinosine phosphorylase [Gammaproteobacteria bacterium]|nr:S-methyl-5'-thioinosine phosphorylase [Gammaproteobacteria bacterium]
MGRVSLKERIAIIGGTGLNVFDELEKRREEQVSTPFGAPSAPLIYGELGDRPVVFLARHGAGHAIAPHRINYRANLWALKQCGAQYIIAVAAVGGIHKEMIPERLSIPNQIIDYTCSRKNTYFDKDLSEVTHIDFTYPYCETLRMKLILASRAGHLKAYENGTYGATEGPRLETAAEIVRLERDGCDMVGMTGMPEAALARELGLCYAACAVCANFAAGRGEGVLSMNEIQDTIARAMVKVRILIKEVVTLI